MTTSEITENYDLKTKVICKGETKSWDEWIKESQTHSQDELLSEEDPNLEYYYVETFVYKKKSTKAE